MKHAYHLWTPRLTESTQALISKAFLQCGFVHNILLVKVSLAAFLKLVVCYIS